MKRRYLTPRERRDMHAAQDGKCTVCSNAITVSGCVAEHWHPVALGNVSKPDCLLCVPCALRKTHGTPATTYGSDIHAIAKVRRLRGENKPKRKRNWPKRKMQSRNDLARRG